MFLVVFKNSIKKNCQNFDTKLDRKSVGGKVDRRLLAENIPVLDAKLTKSKKGGQKNHFRASLISLFDEAYCWEKCKQKNWKSKAKHGSEMKSVNSNKNSL